MSGSNQSLLLAGAATILLGIALYVPPLKLPFGRAAIRIAAFALFTAALLNAGITPNRVLPDSGSALIHGAGQFLIAIWWLGGAAVLNSVLRATLRIRHRPERERLVQDIATTAAYLLAALEVSSKVLGLPVGALLATSGAVAIVVGLALQSALGDAFYGLMLNLTRPYKIGDWIAIDTSLEGRVVETNWRATHLITADHDIAVVPNSTLAKARFINTTNSLPIRGITVRLQLPPNVRPATVTTALEFATHGYEGILRDPAPQITIRASTVEAVEYEVRFFVARHVNSGFATSRYFDLAFQHLDSMNVDRHPPLLNAKPELAAFEDRLIQGALQSIEPHTDGQAKRSLHVETRTLTAAETFVPGLRAPDDRIYVSAGVLSLRQRSGSEEHEVSRLNPGDFRILSHFAVSQECGLIVVPLTDARLLLLTNQPSTPAAVPDNAADHDRADSPGNRLLIKCLQRPKPVSTDWR
jgi:small-conductance mechanosensitive channel